MANKEYRIEWIFDKLVENPKANYTDTYALFYEKFAINRRTFDFDWKAAKKKYDLYIEKVNNAKLEQNMKLELEFAEERILSKLEALEILTNIAKGKNIFVDGKLVAPTFNERRGAIETIAKFNGWFAPVENKVTLDKVEPILIEFFDEN